MTIFILDMIVLITFSTRGEVCIHHVKYDVYNFSGVSQYLLFVQTVISLCFLPIENTAMVEFNN